MNAKDAYDTSVSSSKQNMTMATHITSENAFSEIAIDLLGPIKIVRFEDNYSKVEIHNLCITKIFSRFSEEVVIESIESKTFLTLLNPTY